MVSGSLTMCGQFMGMAVQGLRGVVENAIQRASQATGVDFSFLMKTAGRESGYDPKAKAPTSSAAGLFQFVEQTWLSTLKQYGAKYGYARYADLIEKGADGRYRVRDGDARRTVMDLRLDPQAASLMAGELTSYHAAYLKGRTGRAPTSGELYAAHFLGPQGAARLVEAMQTRPSASAADLFPQAAQANRSIFYRDGRPATVGELYGRLTRSENGVPATGPSSPAAAPVRNDGFIQYASARQADRQREEAALVEMILRGPQAADRPHGGGADLGRSMFTSEMLRVLAEARDDRS
jgi:hypothetical protein